MLKWVQEKSQAFHGNRWNLLDPGGMAPIANGEKPKHECGQSRRDDLALKRSPEVALRFCSFLPG
jgi:hypothetical protein